MNYCSNCGAPVTRRVPEGDTHERHVCQACATVHYQNPKVIAGCVLYWDNRVLLCRRAIEPRYGYWTLPAGFMELGETIQEAAAREALEEANAVAENLTLYGIYSLRHISQVYTLFRGRLQAGRASAGDESLEIGLFRRDQIPWQTLAFPVVRETLERYFEECDHGQFGTHYGEFFRSEHGRIRLQRY